MDDFERKRLLEEKRKLENMAQDPNYQEQVEKEKENRVAKRCTIAITLLVLSETSFVGSGILILMLFGELAYMIVQFIGFVLPIVLIGYIINCKVRYPNNPSIQAAFRVLLTLIIMSIITLVCITAMCDYTCSGCSSTCSDCNAPGPG